MKLHRHLFVWLFVAAAVAIAGCQPDQPAPVDPATQDPLWADVIVSHTSGSVSKKAHVRVRFAEDAVSEERVGKDASSVLSIEPAVAGSLTFADPRGLVLVPSEDLSSGQRYRVTLSRRGLQNIPGALESFVFDFEVIEQAFELELHGLSASAAGDGSMVLGGVLRTADTEDADRIEQMLVARFEGEEKPIAWRHVRDGKAHEFDVGAIIRQAETASLRLEWDGSVIGVDDRGGRDVDIPAEGLFEITGVQTMREAQPYVQVYFSDRLDPQQNLKGLVRLGSGEHTARIQGNILKIYPEPGFEGTVTLILEPGIRNRDGGRLEEVFQQSVAFERQRPQVRFVGKGVILPDNPVLQIPFEAVGVRAVRVAAFQVFEDNVGQFLQSNKLDGARELHRVGRYLWRKKLPLSPTEPNRWNRYSLDATELFDEHPGGLFQLTLSITRADATATCPGQETPEDVAAPLMNNEDLWVQESSGWSYAEDYYGQSGDGSNWRDRRDPCKDAYYQYANGVRDERNFLASNIGLLVKREPTGKLFVVATDLRTSEPMRSVDIDLMNFQDQRIGQARTNANGFAEIDVKATPFYLLAEKGTDKGYLKLSRGTALPVSHLDVGGEILTHGIKATIYGERSVWRPGDDLHLTLVVEDQSGRIPPKHPVTMELMSPRGQIVERLTNADPVGRFYAFTMKTEEDAPTGIWTARARLGGATFTKSLRIETVMPNRLKVNLDFGTETLERSHMPLSAELFGQWLTGALAAGLDADVQVRLTPTPTRFSRSTDFEFDDPARTFAGELETLFEGQLDSEGFARFRANIEVEQQAPGMLRASFSSRVFERGGAFSVSRESFPFSPYDHYVGIKIPKGDATRNMLLTDVEHTVEIASLDREGQPVSLESVRINLYKIDWRWWWDKSGESLAQYASAQHTGVVEQDTIATIDGRGTWTFQIEYPTWGRYLIRACDTVGGHCTGKVFYIDWPGWAGRAQEQSGPSASTLSFVSDKPSYRVGEVANIQLPKATAGRALLTIESGSRILEQRWLEFDGGDAIAPLRIPVTASMAPNIYVSVTLIQPHAGKTNDRPIRLYGIIPLLVEDPETRLEPTLQAPEEWAPRSTAKIQVAEASGRAMTYTVAIVDEGLLGLTNFKTPKLHDHFFKREALGITTWDLFDDVVGAYGGELERLLALGGGNAVDIAQETERKRFPPVVTFLGPFELPASGRNEHQFDIPQYVGAVRVMVVAGSIRGAYGSTDKSVYVRKPLMLLPTLPRVIGPTEELKVPVSTFVMDPSIKDVTLTIEVDDHFEIIGDKTTSLSFETPEEKLGFFSLKAGRRLGTGTVRVTATSGRHHASAEISLEVRSANPATTRVIRTTIDPGASWNTTIEPHGMPGTNRVSLEVSALPPLDLERRVDYLIRYPHGCVEQTTSAAFAQLNLPLLTKLDDGRRAEVERNVQSGIERLRRFQVPNGGFVYWPGGFWVVDTRNNWSTNYVGHFLVEADRLGYYVPAAMLSDWVNHQKSAAHAWTGGSDHAALDQAYRLYTLALAGSAELGAMNRLRESSALPLVARWQLAAAYQLAGIRDAADELVAGQTTDVTHDGKSDPTFGSTLRNQAIVLASLVSLDRNVDAEIVVRKLSRQLASDRWHSTQSVAYSLLALARFAGGAELRTPSFELRLGNGAPTRVQLEAPIHSQPLTSVSDGGTTMIVNNTSDRPLYANVTIRGIPKPGAEQASASGLRLSARYQDLEGNRVDIRRAGQGLDFVAEVSVTNTSGAPLENLALTQILPSGWEILSTRLDEALAGNAKKMSASEYEDIRDDRVLRYFALKAGETKRFVTLVNAAYAGRYYLPSVSVEAMYDATKNARTEGLWVDVVGGKP